MTPQLDMTATNNVLLELYDTVSAALKSNDITAVAATMAALDVMKREVAEMYDQARTVLADMMGDASAYATSEFAFEKKMGAARKAWDHQALAAVVANRLAAMSIDLDTGEIVKSPTEMIADAFQFAGVSYWRVKELQRIGVNADSYCEVLDAKPSIIVRPLSH